MKAELLQIVERILRLHQGAGRNVLPVDRAGQQNAECRDARKQRKRFHFALLEFAYAVIAREQRPAFGDIERAVDFETPRVETNRDVVGEEVVASEVKIDQARKLLPQKENVIGEKIGVNDARGQPARPVPL